MKSLLIPFALLLAGASPIANTAPATAITVAHAYSHPTAAPGVPAVGFLTLTNAGPKADRLLSVISPLAGRVEIHQSKMENGVMQMRAVTQGVALPPGKSVAFAPGGLHLMLFALRAPLAEGERVPVTLLFEHAAAVTTTLAVAPRAPASPEPAEDHSQHQHH